MSAHSFVQYKMLIGYSSEKILDSRKRILVNLNLAVITENTPTNRCSRDRHFVLLSHIISNSCITMILMDK